MIRNVRYSWEKLERAYVSKSQHYVMSKHWEEPPWWRNDHDRCEWQQMAIQTTTMVLKRKGVWRIQHSSEFLPVEFKTARQAMQYMEVVLRMEAT